MIGLGWIGAVTTTTATVKVRSDQASAQLTGAGTVNGHEGNDDVFTFDLSGLTADTTYNITVDDGADTWVASFKTFPSGSASFTFAAGSCCGQNGTGGVADSDAYARIEDRSPLFFLHMGDLHYANITTNSASLYWAKYRDVLTQPKMASMLRSVPMVYAWDDHDYGNDNSGSSSPSKAAAQSAYRDYVPHYDVPANLIYQTFVCGRIRFIVLDVRSARAGATMLGATQKAWLLNLLTTSTEKKLVIVSGVPWLGSNSEGFGGYTSERQDIAEAITTAGTDRVVIVHGDLHMCAADYGQNSQYDPANSDPGPAVFCFAPLNATVSAGSDTYGTGKYVASSQQYGTIDVFDDGTDITIVGTGWAIVNAVESSLFVVTSPTGATMTAETDIAAIADGASNPASRVRTALTAVLGRADGLLVVKAADTSRASNTTASADPDLVVALEAATTYQFEAFLPVEGSTGGDFKVGMTGPGDQTLFVWTTIGQTTAASTTTGSFDQSFRDTSGDTNGRGTTGNVPNGLAHMVHGSITTVSSGNLSVIWAQNSSNGTATVLKAGAYLLARRVA